MSWRNVPPYPPTKGSVLIANKASAAVSLRKGALIMETLKTPSNLYGVTMNSSKSEKTLYRDGQPNVLIRTSKRDSSDYCVLR